MHITKRDNVLELNGSNDGVATSYIKLSSIDGVILLPEQKVTLLISGQPMHLGTLSQENITILKHIAKFENATTKSETTPHYTGNFNKW